jgi:hypothetical protein
MTSMPLSRVFIAIFIIAAVTFFYESVSVFIFQSSQTAEDSRLYPAIHSTDGHGNIGYLQYKRHFVDVGTVWTAENYLITICDNHTPLEKQPANLHIRRNDFVYDFRANRDFENAVLIKLFMTKKR